MAAAGAALPADAAPLPLGYTEAQRATLSEQPIPLKELHRVAIHVPPAGHVSLGSLPLRRVLVPGTGVMLCAVLPAGREDDLRAGASAEAGTTPFWLSNGGVNKARRYCCPRAVSKAAPPKPQLPGVKRTRGVVQQHGDDKAPFHTGCKVAYTVATVDGDRLVIKVAADALQHNHDTNTAPRFVPAWIREAIKEEFDRTGGRRLNAENIAANLNQQAQDDAMAACGFMDWDDAIDSYLSGAAQPPRDAFVDAKYVRDLLRRLSTDKSEVLYNQEEAVAAWVDSVGDDVFYYSPGVAVEKGVKEDPNKAFAVGFTHPWCREQLYEYGHKQCLWMDTTEGVVSTKLHLTVIYCMNKYGTGVPCAWLLHKYNTRATIEGWLNNLAVYMSNSPRHKSWPAPPPLRLPTNTDCKETNAANAKANAAAAAAADVAPSPAPRSAARSSTVVRAFRPAVIMIDVSMKVETPAIEYGLWGGGYEGYGFRCGNPTVPAWCSWHLIQAWMRNLDIYFTNPPAAKKRKRGDDADEEAAPARDTGKGKAPAPDAGKEKHGCDNPVTKAMIRQSLKELRDNTVENWETAENLVNLWISEWRPLAPRFVEYFEKNYAGEYMLWLRCCYLRYVPPDMHYRFTTGTQIAESGFGKMKAIELSERPMLRTRKVDWFLQVIHGNLRRRYQMKHIALSKGWLPKRRTYNPPARAAPLELEAAPASGAAAITPTHAPAAKKARVSAVEEASMTAALAAARAAGADDRLIAAALFECKGRLDGLLVKAQDAAAKRAAKRSPQAALVPAPLVPRPGAMPGNRTGRALRWNEKGVPGFHPGPQEVADAEDEEDERTPPPRPRRLEAAVPSIPAAKSKEKAPFVKITFSPAQAAQARSAKKKLSEQKQWPAQMRAILAEAAAGAAGPSGPETAV